MSEIKLDWIHIHPTSKNNMKNCIIANVAIGNGSVRALINRDALIKAVEIEDTDGKYLRIYLLSSGGDNTSAVVIPGMTIEQFLSAPAAA